jgi:hypothetical protein
MRRDIAGLSGMAALLFAGGALAHHAYVMFDVQKEVTLQGVVKDFQWTSPHILVDLMVRDAAGKEAEWPIEGASPSMLSRFGWTRSSMKPGDHIDLVIHPRRDGSAGGSLVKATVNGQVVGEQPKA